jgi:uncharacterized membrane protein
MQAELFVLRALHVVLGVLWVGGAVFLQFALMPALLTVGPPAGPVMGALQGRRLFRWLPWIALVTILVGVRLLWIVSGGMSLIYLESGAGRTFVVSGALAGVAFGVIMLVSRPAAIRAGGLAGSLAGKDGPAREVILAEIALLRKRSAWVGGVATVLLVLSTLGMAVARYV